MKRAKSIADIARQYGRIWNLYPNNPRTGQVTQAFLRLQTRIAEKIGVRKIYSINPADGLNTWCFAPDEFYANYETRVVL